MTEHPMRVLLVDGQVEDSRWVQDLLLDFSESRYGGSQWMTGIEVFHLQRLEDALVLLSDQTKKGGEAVQAIDAVLLNPALPDSFGLPSLLKTQSAAPHLPILVLSDVDDPDLALSMIRAGAQDFLVKPELDCMPLARALHLAIERQRTLTDLRTLSWRDSVTGLYNSYGFETFATNDIAACRRMGHLLAAIVIEAAGLEGIAKNYGREERDMVLIELAETVRAIVEPPSTVAYLGGHRFAVALPATDPAEAQRVVELLRRRFLKLKAGATRQSLRLRVGLHFHQPDADASVRELIEAASAELCENIGVARPLPDPVAGWYERWARQALRKGPEKYDDHTIGAANRSGCNV